MFPTLESDTTIFDDQFFFFFRNKYKPEIITYLEEKHYYEVRNELTIDAKRISLYTWNTILVREIVHLGFTIEHLEKRYNELAYKIFKAKDLSQLHQVEIEMVSKYIDMIINQQEATDHLMVNKILHYLHMHIEDTISLDKVTRELKLSQSHASKIFKDHMGTSIMKYSRLLKIERAKALLKTNQSITVIGELLGFYDQSHFSKTFKSIVGVSPKQYQIKSD